MFLPGDIIVPLRPLTWSLALYDRALESSEVIKVSNPPYLKGRDVVYVVCEEAMIILYVGERIFNGAMNIFVKTASLKVGWTFDTCVDHYPQR